MTADYPKLHYGIVDEVEHNIFEVVFDREEDACRALRFFASKHGAYGVTPDDEGLKWLLRADLNMAAGIDHALLRGTVIGFLVGWLMSAETN